MPLLGQAPCVLAVRGRVRHPRPLWPNREASEVSPCHPQELSPVSQISRCHCCLLARSLSPLAGSDPGSAPPPPGALGPRCPAPRVATLPVSEIGFRACPAVMAPPLRGIQGMFQSRRRVPKVARSAPTVLGNGGVLWRLFIRPESGAVFYATALAAMLAMPPSRDNFLACTIVAKQGLFSSQLLLQ
ncbi:hypothetical protein NDU88_000452 [Pleurodeles waltl]|uniref:Uncharacterized protein n=1 Tax=Pleurodeles waltl TaxID=8319 RepID=A0AAV7TFV8_PLEWA|nr:hypothetical protein NDU88_000452 [Pleurodeles waltl]